MFHIVRTYRYHALLYKFSRPDDLAPGTYSHVVLGFKEVLRVNFAIHVPVALSANILRPTNPFHVVKPPTKQYLGVVVCVTLGGWFQVITNHNIVIFILTSLRL